MKFLWASWRRIVLNTRNGRKLYALDQMVSMESIMRSWVLERQLSKFGMKEAWIQLNSSHRRLHWKDSPSME